MQPTCSDQPILNIWPNFEGILCNLDDVVHMNRGLPDEWRSFSPLTSNITSHLWDCSKDCPHLLLCILYLLGAEGEMFFFCECKHPKDSPNFRRTLQVYRTLTRSIWLCASRYQIWPPSKSKPSTLFSPLTKIIIIIVWILSQNWCVCLALGLPAVYEMCPSSSSSASSW